MTWRTSLLGPLVTSLLVGSSLSWAVDPPSQHGPPAGKDSPRKPAVAVHSDAASVRAKPSSESSGEWHVPAGWTLHRVAGPPLVDRPICAAFDWRGRLYVAESSGTNDPVEKQLAERPHRIVRLSDRDGDGTFDHRTVFADRMMFPEGILWHDGSVYVAAPPVIWKLTDSDDDGVAERREVWFDGKTLTHCANDLHGPYLGRDGWIYWCKGAFAEQTYERDGKPWKTRAAHIFRRRAAGGPVEAVMTGGMDNPVEVVFTPSGERIFTTTFLQHPRAGKRDGLIHAVWGGLYGKRHSVLDGHRRTGDLLPPLVHLGAAAPCGLAHLESTAGGMPGDLLACSFNMHKVTHHRLDQEGATFRATTEDWLVSENVDFHPTDVLEDADGSILVIDTGGWYKLCCPTSHLWKPDVLGAIYRLQRRTAPTIEDPRGATIDWKRQTPQQLIRRLDDARPVVRRRAAAELVQRGAAALPALRKSLTAQGASERQRRETIWCAVRIESHGAADLLVAGLRDDAHSVRCAALNSVSLLRVAAAEPDLLHLLGSRDPMTRRLAAEALGRIGSRRAVEPILERLAAAADRFERHALIEALIEIADVAATRRGLRHPAPAVRSGAAIALAQIDDDALAPSEVLDWIIAADPSLRDAALLVLRLRPSWRTAFARWLDEQLARNRKLPAGLLDLIAARGNDRLVQETVQRWLAADDGEAAHRTALLEAIGRAPVTTLPTSWEPVLTRLLQDRSADVRSAAVRLLHGKQLTAAMVRRLWPELVRFALDPRHPRLLRLRALSAAGEHRPLLKTELFAFVLDVLRDETASVEEQLAAVSVLRNGTMSLIQRRQATALLATLPPMPLQQMLGAFARTRAPSEQAMVVARLEANPYLESLPVSAVRSLFTHPTGASRQALQRLGRRIDATVEAQRKELDKLLESLPPGDAARGYAVFFSRKTACASCHSIGYLGGDIGPDLTRVGQIRTTRDLLEAIVFPSASFVRSFEPVMIECADGRVASGIIRDESSTEIVLATAADRVERIARDNIEAMMPGRTSIMPSGFAKLLSRQELADLVTFLKNAR